MPESSPVQRIPLRARDGSVRAYALVDDELDGSSVRFKMPQNEEHTLAFRRVKAAPSPPTPPKPPTHRPVA
jgi:hypothetical protein